jgi:hypothetical protein
MDIGTDTYANWEKGKTEPVASQFRPVLQFLGYDPMPEPKTLIDRLEAKRRVLGVTFEQVARYLRWDPGTLVRYLDGTWRMPRQRAASLEAFLKAPSEDLAQIRSLPRR